MALHTQQVRTNIGLNTRELTGGVRQQSRFERPENVRTSRISGSHMPLDGAIHWSWRNPLNLIPASLALVFIYALVGTVVSLF